MEENQLSQIKEFSTSLCMGRCKCVGSLNHSLYTHLSYLGPVSCVFTSWVSSGLNVRSGCSPMAASWQVFFPSWISLGLTGSHWVKWKWLSCVQLFATPWNSPGQNTGVDSLSLLQGIFPTQRLNRGLLHCSQILYQLSHKGSPRILEWVAYPFSSRSSQPRNWTGSPAVQADSLLTEISGKPLVWYFVSISAL